MYTVNELMVLENTIKSRLADLRALRSQLAVKETYYGANNPKTVEPQYDIKFVDKKIVELQNFLLKADSAIKQSNAITKVEVEIDLERLLEPLS